MSVLASMMLFCGCDVHQWPERDADIDPDPVIPPSDAPKVKIPMSLEYETDFYVWKHYYDPKLGQVEEADPSINIFPEYPGASSKYDNIVPSCILQVYVKVFPASNNSVCVAEHSFTMDINGTYDTDIEMEMPGENTYDVVVWSQLLETSQSKPFYDPSSFSQIHIINGNYDGNTNYRDGFRGRIRIDAFTGINNRYVVRMQRPMGKFELVTTDLSEFLDRETVQRRLTTRASADDYRVVISYPNYYPSSYEAMDDRLENSISGMSFETRMTVTGESEASLGFDYVMINNIMDGGVQARVDVYRPDGTHVAGSSTLTIPIRRDYHTLLRGTFLTMDGGGGVGIDPGFNGDHNVSTW